jgi:hypothetical protein
MNLKWRFRFDLTLVALILVVCGIVFEPQLKELFSFFVQKISGKKTIKDRVRQYAPAVRTRLTPYFEKAGVEYPPKALALLAFKKEKKFEVYGANQDGNFKWIRSYPILAASGNLGPKLQEGDRQVPEGLYAIELLNPNSLYHLSLRVSYPNNFDRAQAKKDGRTQLGGDIMIHGNSVSIGCLAMGDSASEDLFILAEATGLSNVAVIMSPIDLRIHPLSDLAKIRPDWTKGLYPLIQKELARYSHPNSFAPISKSLSK